MGNDDEEGDPMYLHSVAMICLCLLTFSCLMLIPRGGHATIPGNTEDPEAVKEVLSGKRTVANAAWWGFDEFDATEALQSAINSGAKRVIVPNMTRDWIVRPINLAGDQELVFEDGVVVTAKRGEFKGKGECLFRGVNIRNLTIRGYGATWRMQKMDYISGMHLKALRESLGSDNAEGTYDYGEWRRTLILQSCADVEVLGLILRDSGGDGICLCKGDVDKPFCQNIHIMDVVCDNNLRQGISVVSAENLLIENCVFKNTWGTPPAAGIDLEPDLPTYRLREITIRNCVFQENYGNGIHIFLGSHAPDPKRLKAAGIRPLEDVSVLIDSCRVSSSMGGGIRVAGVREKGARGLIEFRDCTIENVGKFGLEINRKSADGVHLRFDNCIWRNVARGCATEIPLQIILRPHIRRNGGVEFVKCMVEDDRARPFIIAREEGKTTGLHDITGEVTVCNPWFRARRDSQSANNAVTALGDKTHNVNLRVMEKW